MVARPWGPESLGELTITYDGAVATIHGPPGGGREVLVDAAPDALREWIRCDDSGRYRPLSGARTQRGGWQARCLGVGVLTEALDAVYPLALVHLDEARQGTLRTVDLRHVLDRQTGRYEVAARLDAPGRDAAVRTLCGGCVRAPAWAGHATLTGGAIPCPEPCSVLVSLCREAAAWQDNPPLPARIDEEVGWANFEQPGNGVRESYLAARYPDMQPTAPGGAD